MKQQRLGSRVEEIEKRRRVKERITVSDDASQLEDGEKQRGIKPTQNLPKIKPCKTKAWITLKETSESVNYEERDINH